jgi:hypothetical protein
MNWNAPSATGQLAPAVAVLVTLIYMARQLRQANRQSLLSAFQHTYDSLNEWALSVVQSGDVAAIILHRIALLPGSEDGDGRRISQVGHGQSRHAGTRLPQSPGRPGILEERAAVLRGSR